MPQQTDLPLKDIRVEVKVRNNLILSRMEHRGINSVAELARQLGIESQKKILGDLINMTRAARNKDGKWDGLAYKLADFFECMPEDLFSEFQQDIALEKNRSYAEVTYAELQRLTAWQQETITPELEYQAQQLRDAINQALQSLTPREERIIRLRFGFNGEDLTLEEIGEQLDVSGESVRQIEGKALRKLKHPALRKALRATVLRTGKFKSSWRSGELVDAEYLDDQVLKAL